MRNIKVIASGMLLLLGFWCLGRALETAFNQDPNLMEKREIITAGILLGLPATALGGGLIWRDRRQRHLSKAHYLRDVFFHLITAEKGKITPLKFAMAARIDGDEAKAYLRDRCLEFDATFQVDAEGTIFYCFEAGNNR